MPMLASWPCQAFRRPRPILEEHTNYSQHPVQSIYRAPAIISIYSLTTAQPPSKNNQNNVVTTKINPLHPTKPTKKAEKRPLLQKPPKKPKNHSLTPTNPPPTLPSQPPDLAPAQRSARPACPPPARPVPTKKRGPQTGVLGALFGAQIFRFGKPNFHDAGPRKKRPFCGKT